MTQTKSERDRAYYQANKERLKEKSRQYHAANRERINARHKDYMDKLRSDVYVYRWSSPDGFVAYVGRGSIQRAKQHIKSSRWYQPNMFLRVLKARNEWHAMKLEGLWGEMFQPLFNREGYRYE